MLSGPSNGFGFGLLGCLCCGLLSCFLCLLVTPWSLSHLFSLRGESPIKTRCIDDRPALRAPRGRCQQKGHKRDRTPGKQSDCGGPWIWGWQNCTSRSQKLEPHLLVKVHSASAPWLNYCRSQCNIRLAAEIDIVIFEWQQEGVRKQRLSNSCLKTGAGKAEVEQ